MDGHMQKILTNCTESSKTCSLEVHRKTELAPSSPCSWTQPAPGSPSSRPAAGHGSSRGRSGSKATADGSDVRSRERWRTFRGAAMGARGSSRAPPQRHRALAPPEAPSPRLGRSSAPAPDENPHPSSAPRGKTD